LAACPNDNVDARGPGVGLSAIIPSLGVGYIASIPHAGEKLLLQHTSQYTFQHASQYTSLGQPCPAKTAKGRSERRRLPVVRALVLAIHFVEEGGIPPS